MPTTGDTHRNVLMKSCENQIFASHSISHTCFTRFTSVEIHRARQNQTISESITKNKKRAQPLSERSDDGTMRVGSFRTDCRARSSSSTGANVCFTTRVRVPQVWPALARLPKLFSRRTPIDGKQLHTPTARSSLLSLRACVLKLIGAGPFK